MKIPHNSAIDLENITSALQILEQMTEGKLEFEGPMVMSVHLFPGEEFQLIFDHLYSRDHTLQYGLDKNFGVEFRYGLKDAWNNAGKFCSFTLFALGEKVRQICSVTYILHNTEGAHRLVDAGEEEGTLCFDSILELDNVLTKAIWFAKTITEIMELNKVIK